VNNGMPRDSRALALTLLAASGLTIMASAIISPSLPGIRAAFADVPQVELLARLVLTLPALAVALLAPVAGTLLDRVGRRPVLLGSLGLYALAGASGMLLPTLPAILVGRALLGASVAGIMTSATTLITDSFQGAARRKLLGLQAAWTGAAGASSLVIGGAISTLSWRAPYALYLVAALLIPAVLTLVPRTAKVTTETTRDRPSDDIDPARGKLLAPVFLLAALTMVLLYLVPVQAPFLLTSRFQARGAAIGGAVSVVTLVSVVGSIFFARLLGALGRKRLHGLGFASLALGFALFAGAQSWPAVVVSLSFVGMGMGLLLPALVHDISELAREDRRGAAMGMLTGSLFAGQFVSPILAQPFVDHGGITQAFAVASGLSLLVAAAPFLVLKPVPHASPDLAGR
jgi:MFS family permease